MKIADLPEFKNRTKVLSCAPSDTVYDAVVAMTYKKCGAIAVTENDKLIGIFTERDLLARVVGQGRDVESTQVSEVMSQNIETATPQDSVVLCMGRMSHGRFRHLPVVDSEGQLSGMLSQGDFVAYTIRVMKEDLEKTK